MVKINVIRMPKKDFERQFGTYAYGGSGITNGWTIAIKETIKSPRIIKGTMAHEMGHIFSHTRNITQKIPLSEKRKILVEAKSSKGYEQRGAVSGKAKMQEALADMYYYSHGTPYERKIMRKEYPKTYKIINKEIKKFKPQLKRLNYHKWKKM